MAYALARFTGIVIALYEQATCGFGMRQWKRESVKNRPVVGAVREPPAPEHRPFSYRYDSSVSFLHPMPVG